MQKIKARLEMAAAENEMAGANKGAHEFLSTGCCTIQRGGSKTSRSGISQRQCSDIANSFNATYTFDAGVSCP
jgi:hypothetical protein